MDADLHRYAGNSNLRSFFKHYLSSPGFRFIWIFRKCQKHRRNPLLFPIYRLLLERYRFKYGFEIPLGCTIGRGFYLLHFGGVVIHPETVIGENCDVGHGVTLGREYRGKRQGAPNIGNRVWIGPGAVIVGKVRIGDDSLIAPNSFVNFDVPDNSVVIGNPGKVVSKKGSAGYIRNAI